MEVEVKANHDPGAGKASRKKRSSRKPLASRRAIVATAAGANEDTPAVATPPRSDQTPDSQGSKEKHSGGGGGAPPLQPPRNKAASLMQQHRSVWQNEFQKLEDAEEKLKNDIVDKLRYISSTGISSEDEAGQCLEDWIDYELERTKFQDSADSRVEWFRRILACRLGFMDDDDEEQGGDRKADGEGSEGAQPSVQSDAQMISELREAQRETRQLTSVLEVQFREADAQVARAFEESPLSNSRFTFSRNVEEDFASSWSGDERLRRPLLAELKQIDHKFESKIKDIDKAHKLEEEPADWSADDYAVVQHVLEQYPSNLGNRRALIMDWLRRHFKKRSILDISTYMTWCQNQRYHKDKVQSCIQEWERARVQWLQKAKQSYNAAAAPIRAPGPPQRRRTVHTVPLRSSLSQPKKADRLPRIVPESAAPRVPRQRARVRIAAPGDSTSSPPPSFVPPARSKAQQLQQAERREVEQKNHEWRLRSLSTVREIEGLRMLRKQSVAALGTDDTPEAQELAKVQRRLNLERVKFRQELAMKKQRDRIRAEQKRQDEARQEKFKNQKPKKSQ
ncbi:uncharacterized protein LOC144168815 [Haemaphysalis longicornis]